jgi:dCMP deaminase
MTRPSWDEYFMSIAQLVKERSTCVRRHVGAVLVKDRRVMATGYNGTPTGLPHCDEGGCERCNSEVESGTNLEACACSHAEENVIVQAALHGTSTRGATLYTTHSPCTQCAKMIINARISRVVAAEEYPDALGTSLLSQARIQLDHFEKNDITA